MRVELPQMLQREAANVHEQLRQALPVPRPFDKTLCDAWEAHCLVRRDHTLAVRMKPLLREWDQFASDAAHVVALADDTGAYSDTSAYSDSDEEDEEDEGGTEESAEEDD